MALSDGKASPDQVIQIEKLYVEKAAKDEERRLAEQRLLSEEREYCADDGTVWQYVVSSETFVRILGCKTGAETLAIPSEIEGKPVEELAVDACSYLESVHRIICADSIREIGACAFRVCKNLG